MNQAPSETQQTISELEFKHGKKCKEHGCMLAAGFNIIECEEKEPDGNGGFECKIVRKIERADLCYWHKKKRMLDGQT